MRRPVAKDRNSPPPLSCGRGETFPRHRPRADGVGQLPLGPRTYFMTLFMRRRRRRAKKRGLISIDGRGGEGRRGECERRREKSACTNEPSIYCEVPQPVRACFKRHDAQESTQRGQKSRDDPAERTSAARRRLFGCAELGGGGGERREKDGEGTGE